MQFILIKCSEHDANQNHWTNWRFTWIKQWKRLCVSFVASKSTGNHKSRRFALWKFDKNCFAATHTQYLCWLVAKRHIFGYKRAPMRQLKLQIDRSFDWSTLSVWKNRRWGATFWLSVRYWFSYYFASKFIFFWLKLYDLSFITKLFYLLITCCFCHSKVSMPTFTDAIGFPSLKDISSLACYGEWINLLEIWLWFGLGIKVIEILNQIKVKKYSDQRELCSEHCAPCAHSIRNWLVMSVIRTNRDLLFVLYIFVRPMVWAIILCNPKTQSWPKNSDLSSLHRKEQCSSV